MDEELFKQKLTEVADWKIPETPRETSLNAKKRRGRKSQEEQYQQDREEMFFDEFGGVNPTYPPLLTKLKIQSCECPDCGKICEQGRRCEVKVYEGRTRYWRHRCVTCGLVKNPYTGKFDLDLRQAQVKWHSYIKEKNGSAKSEKVFEEDHCVIRINPDIPHSI